LPAPSPSIGPAEPSPSPVAQASPSPAPSPSRIVPALTGGPPPYVSPCPPAASGGYAYLDHGEVFYRTAIGAPPTQLTSTGSRVDDFWWTPDGTRLLYKVVSSPPDIAGDVRMISLSTRQQLWDLGASTQFFTLSPDGSSWAAGTISVQNGNNVGVQVTIRALLTFPWVTTFCPAELADSRRS